MTTPIQINTQNVNFALGFSNTAAIALGRKEVKHLGAKPQPFSSLTVNGGSGTNTAPTGATHCTIRAWGGGGGGGAFDDSIGELGQVGGGGGFVYRTIAVTGGSTQITYSVGAGGAGGTGDGAGSSGGTTTISNAVIMTANGGGGGSSTAGTGGPASGGTHNLAGRTNGDAGGREFGGGAAGGFAPGGAGFGGSSPFQNGSQGANGRVILDYYGTNPEVDLPFSDLRWGINFRGGYCGTTFYDNYANANSMFITMSDTSTGPATATANAVLQLFSNGQMVVTALDRGVITATNRNTWLSSGVNSDYTANLFIRTGDPILGANSNTNINMSNNIVWYQFVQAAASESDSARTEALLIIRRASDSVTLFTRPVIFDVTAINTYDPCPLCCFTPDTLITMADRSTKRIVDVIVGDSILSYDEITNTNIPVTVTGVIIRTQRAMYEYEFENGKTLKASDDHPLYVVGKGYASINPTIAYKDLGIPKLICIGDIVKDENGNQTKILNIKPIDYSDEVYTFNDSRFYANNVLVY